MSLLLELLNRLLNDFLLLGHNMSLPGTRLLARNAIHTPLVEAAVITLLQAVTMLLAVLPVPTMKVHRALPLRLAIALSPANASIEPMSPQAPFLLPPRIKQVLTEHLPVFLQVRYESTTPLGKTLLLLTTNGSKTAAVGGNLAKIILVGFGLPLPAILNIGFIRIRLELAFKHEKWQLTEQTLAAGAVSSLGRSAASGTPRKFLKFVGNLKVLQPFMLGHVAQQRRYLALLSGNNVQSEPPKTPNLIPPPLPLA